MILTIKANTKEADEAITKLEGLGLDSGKVREIAEAAQRVARLCGSIYEAEMQICRSMRRLREMNLFR